MRKLVKQSKLVAIVVMALLLSACSDGSNQVLSLPSEAHTNESLIVQTAEADARFKQQAVSGTRSARIFETETELLEFETSVTDSRVIAPVERKAFFGDLHVHTTY